MRCPRFPSQILVLALLALAACGPPPEQHSGIGEAIGDVSFGVPPGAPVGQPVDLGQIEGGRPEAAFPGETYYGRQQVGPTGVARAQRQGDGTQVNFDGADVREVVRVILGDILGATYTIDPALGGEVVLNSAGALSDAELLRVLESILAINGGTLVSLGDNAYAVRLAEEVVTGGASVAGLAGGLPEAGPGSGVTIVPLDYISASNAAQFIQPLVGQPEQIRIDEARNLLLFAGSGAERQNVLETLRDLDVNWMAGRSIGIFPLANATPEALVPELESLFTPLAAPDLGAGTIRFLPVARLNAVLAVAQGQDQIREVARWVERLDRGSQQGIQFFVYQLQHAPANEVARILAQSLSDEPIADAGGDGFGSAARDTSGLGLGGQGLGEEGAPPSAFLDEEGNFSENGEFGSDEDRDQAGGAAYNANLSTGGPLGDLGPVRIVANPRNNSLLVRATPRAYELIEATLRRLDTAPLQVLIEATIAEVILNDQLRYGVQYFLESGDVQAGFNTTAASGAVGIGSALLNPLARLPGFNFLYQGGDVTVAIDALARVTDVRVLSSPSVVVQDNRLATLSVGSEVPIVTRVAQSIDDLDAPVLNNIEYRETGVILKVRPRISSNDNVSLEIGQEVSRVDEAAISAVDSPTFTQRRITSEVNILSNQTVVLGGLIQDSENLTQNKIPLLGDIPVLGNLFRSNDRTAGRTELIVFLTPRIVRNAADARDVSEELRSRMRSLRPVGYVEPPAVNDDRPITLPGDPVLEGTAPRPAPLPPAAIEPTPGVRSQPLPPRPAQDASAAPERSFDYRDGVRYRPWTPAESAEPGR